MIRTQAIRETPTLPSYRMEIVLAALLCLAILMIGGLFFYLARRPNSDVIIGQNTSPPLSSTPQMNAVPTNIPPKMPKPTPIHTEPPAAQNPDEAPLPTNYNVAVNRLGSGNYNMPVNRPMGVPQRTRPVGPPPLNSTAICADGTYSAVLSIRFACAGNGGVVQWLVSGIQEGHVPRAICKDGHISYWQADHWATCLTGGGVRWWYRE